MPRRAGNQRRKTPQAGKRYPLNMRTTFDIRANLEAAAAASGRSLAQEAEYRIDESFRTDELLGGPEMRPVARLMVASFNALGGAYDDFVGPDWRRDRVCYLEAVLTVSENLMAAAPGGPPNPDEVDKTVDRLAERLKARLKSHWEIYAASRKEGGEA